MITNNSNVHPNNGDFLATCSASVDNIISHYEKEAKLRAKYSEQYLMDMPEDEFKALFHKYPEKPKNLYYFKLSYPNQLSVTRSIFPNINANGLRSLEKAVKPKYGTKKNHWLPYHLKLFPQANGKWILVLEGEKPCDYALNDGYISTSIIGSHSNSKSDFTVFNRLFDEAVANGIKGLVYIADHDEAGIKKAIKFYKAYSEYPNKNLFEVVLLPTSELIKKIAGKVADKGDDYVELSRLIPEDKKEHARKLLEYIITHEGDNYTTELLSYDQQYDNLFTKKKQPSKSPVTFDDEDIEVVKQPWLLQAQNELFSGHWLHNGIMFHKYNGSIYEAIEDGIIKRDITKWCANYIDDKGKKSLASPHNIKKVFDWCKNYFYISPSMLNCEGLPLNNGYLVSEVRDNKPHFTLKPYSPDVYFTYQGKMDYDPHKDLTPALKLLECLDDPYKSLFLESISTILNPDLIRQKYDRIRALMLVGEGSNGKDTLREIISLILGKKGITSCSLNDFKQSDNGRGFSLHRLASMPRINWSSENKQIAIDSIQSLKQAITGDPISVEAKGKDRVDIELKALFLFNSNQDPKLKGDQKAIQSRLAIIPFTKVYSMTPQRGELKADPKFKHDKDFLIKEVAPAMLNLMIIAFGNVYRNGINYQATSDYTEKIQLESNHLRRFAKDINLEFTNDDRDLMKIGEVYNLLDEWYYYEGYYDWDNNGKKPKKVWLDDGEKDDPIIKSSNKFKPRLLELFPKATEYKRDRVTYIRGIRIQKNNVDSLPTPEKPLNNSLEGNCTDSFLPSLTASSIHSFTDSFELNNHQNDSLSKNYNLDPMSQEMSQEMSQASSLQPIYSNSFSKNNESSNKLTVQKNSAIKSEKVKHDDLNIQNNYNGSHQIPSKNESIKHNKDEWDTLIYTLGKLFTELKITDRELRLNYVSKVVGFTPKSIMDLNDDQLVKIVNQLSQDIAINDDIA